MQVKQNRRPRGVTLLELLVVIVILVALAGVLIPMLPSMLSRAHESSSATTLAELTNNLQLHNNLYQGEPNRWDSLLADAGSGLDTWEVEPVEDVVTAGLMDMIPLNAAQAESLAEAGITEVFDMVDDPDNATFNANVATARGLGDAEEVMALTAAGITASETELGAQPDVVAPGDLLVVFGIGQNCTAVGRTMAAAPVHFSDHGHGPEEEYSRFIVVYRAFGSGERARFVGVLAMDHDEFTGIPAHLKGYYEATETDE